MVAHISSGDRRCAGELAETDASNRLDHVLSIAGKIFSNRSKNSQKLKVHKSSVLSPSQKRGWQKLCDEAAQAANEAVIEHATDRRNKRSD